MLGNYVSKRLMRGFLATLVIWQVSTYSGCLGGSLQRIFKLVFLLLYTGCYIYEPDYLTGYIYTNLIVHNVLKIKKKQLVSVAVNFFWLNPAYRMKPFFFGLQQKPIVFFIYFQNIVHNYVYSLLAAGRIMYMYILLQRFRYI